MSSNSVNPVHNNDVENQSGGGSNDRILSTPVQLTVGKYVLKIFTSSLNLFAYLLIGFTVGISLLFALSNGLPVGPTEQHIILCVIGYQLIMTSAVLSQSPDNGWSAFLTLKDKRRAHALLQVIGSGLAIAGCFIKIISKEEHWNSLHGKFALVALVFTVASLVNGLTSLYAFELRRCLPGNLSKLTHICFGTVTVLTASISLCLGFNKTFFRNWATEDFTNTLILFTFITTFIVIISPIFTFFNKSWKIIKK